MASSTGDNKLSRKRPNATGELVGVRLQPPMLNAVDDWRRTQDDLPGRPEAIRRILEIGLAVPAKSAWKTSAAREASAASAEKHATDHMDKALKGETDSVKAARKKQLTSMPGGIKRR